MPSKEQDIVKIHQTYGTPENENKAHDFDTQLTYDGDDNLTKVEEYLNNTLRKEEILSYLDGDLTEVNVKIYDTDGETVELEYIDTLNYDKDGNITSIDRTVL